MLLKQTSSRYAPILSQALSYGLLGLQLSFWFFAGKQIEQETDGHIPIVQAAQWRGTLCQLKAWLSVREQRMQSQARAVYFWVPLWLAKTVEWLGNGLRDRQGGPWLGLPNCWQPSCWHCQLAAEDGRTALSLKLFHGSLPSFHMSLFSWHLFFLDTQICSPCLSSPLWLKGPLMKSYISCKRTEMG